MKEETFEYENGKEHLTMYVTKEFKEIWEQSQDKRKLFDKYIVQHIEDVKKDIKISVASLDEETLVFRASAIKYKQEFEEVAKTIESDSYNLWERVSERRSKLTENFNKTREEIGKVSDEIKKVEGKVKELNDKLVGISPYRLENLLEVLNKIENLSEKKQKIFSFLLNNREEWL